MLKLADRVVYVGGNPVKLIDNGDGTFIIGTSADVTANIDVSLTNSIPEYGWVDGETEPTPTEFAFGVKVNPGTGAITVMYWDGTSWEVI